MQDYSAIKETLSICRDAEQGFRGAANAVKTRTLKTLFEEYSAQRRNFADELHRVATNLGLDVANPTGVAGVLHAGWMELKGALTGHSEHQILTETARGEELSLKNYRDALAMSISDQLRTVLQNQFAQIQQSHDRIVNLRDSTARVQSDEPHTHGAS